MLLRDTVNQACGQTGGHWLSKGSHVTTIWFLSRDVKTIKFNQYLPVILTPINVV